MLGMAKKPTETNVFIFLPSSCDESEKWKTHTLMIFSLPVINTGYYEEVLKVWDHNSTNHIVFHTKFKRNNG